MLTTNDLIYVIVNTFKINKAYQTSCLSSEYRFASFHLLKVDTGVGGMGVLQVACCRASPCTLFGDLCDEISSEYSQSAEEVRPD